MTKKTTCVPDLHIKWAYDPPDKADGTRVLVDRLWPRGLRKESAALALWSKDIAPTSKLRQWFGHDPNRWVEFKRRYRAELADNDTAVAQVIDLLKRGRVTLLFAASDPQHNNAVILEAYLREQLKADHGHHALELSSPACFAHEADDRYMGFASRDELLSALNELLEAERAGARVTLRTASDAPEDLKPLIMAVHRDEARWCGVLTKAIRRLDGTPSSKTGAFNDKAMAITDIPARLALLNRGQDWVVRKLKKLLPMIRDETIHADLAAMLGSHEHNIGLVAKKLPGSPRQEVPR